MKIFFLFLFSVLSIGLLKAQQKKQITYKEIVDLFILDDLEASDKFLTSNNFRLSKTKKFNSGTDSSYDYYGYKRIDDSFGPPITDLFVLYRDDRKSINHIRVASYNSVYFYKLKEECASSEGMQKKGERSVDNCLHIKYSGGAFMECYFKSCKEPGQVNQYIVDFSFNFPN